MDPGKNFPFSVLRGPTEGAQVISEAQRLRLMLAIITLIYAIVAYAVIALGRQSPRSLQEFADWVAVPVQAIAIGVTALLVRSRLGTTARTATIWALVCAFSAVSLMATIIWNFWRPLGGVPHLSYADLCYFIDYALLTLAYAAAFMRFGGSFRDLRTWLDAAAILVALMGAMWAMLLGAGQTMASAAYIGMSYVSCYAVSLGLLLTAAALLFLRMPGAWRPVLVLLILAGLADAVWELGWLATWRSSHNYVGLYYNFGDLLCFVLIAFAAAIAPERPSPARLALNPERSAYAFMPTLITLLAIAFVSISLASSRSPKMWILVALVATTAVLLFAREAAASRELAALNRAFAFRVADTRLTELVRQSQNVYVVLDAAGIVTFASPAIEGLLDAPARQVGGALFSSLFGAEHESVLTQYVAQLTASLIPPAPLELACERDAEARRIYRLTGANQLTNQHIAGLTLTITEITEQRTLERDVLEAANRERLRLAGDLHDGLGQELSGIAMLLQSLLNAPSADIDGQRQRLQEIVNHLSHSIRDARDLAHGLSPLYVVRGSLRAALQRLGREGGVLPEVNVSVDALLDDQQIDDFPADHLLRIAHEAVQNATRHAACKRITVALTTVGDDLVLSVSDDGVGCAAIPASDGGLGLRFMEYRARLIGATFHIGPQVKCGTLVQVTVLLRNVSRRAQSVAYSA